MRRTLASLAVASALLVLPAPAAIAESIKSTGATLKLDGTNGFRATVGGARPYASVDIHRGALGASYLTRADVGRRSLHAEFGTFGAVHLRFDPKGEPTVRRLPMPGCNATVTIREGTWNGSIEFVAEGGITALSAASAAGKVLTHRFNCRPPDLESFDKPPRRTEEPTFLEAYAGSRFGRLGSSFHALHESGRNRVDFYADETHKAQGVTVSNYAEASAPKAAFRYDRARRHARVTPPPPFTGSAEFTKPKGEPAIWEGDLSVELLSGPLQLTGPDFRAALDPPGVILVGSRLARTGASPHPGT